MYREKVFCIVINIILFLQRPNTAGAFVCKSSTWAFTIEDKYLCDGFNDCYDKLASDECGCPDTMLNVCKTKRCILARNICDGNDDCEDGSMSDEQGCFKGIIVAKSPIDPCSRRDAVRCADQVSCVKAKQLCDGTPDCPDGSDEVFEGPGLKCVVKSHREVTCTLPQVNVFDDVPQCQNNIDLCFDSSGSMTESCFQCLDGKHVISEYQVCDGILDCSDFSDECLCDDVKTPYVCHQLYSPSLNPGLCLNRPNARPERKSSHAWIKEIEVECGDGSCTSVSSLCNDKKECYAGTDELYCRTASNRANKMALTSENVLIQTLTHENTSHTDINKVNCTLRRGRIVEAVMCDGEPTCDDLEDECDPKCMDIPDFCNVNLTCLRGSQICDGIWNSDDECPGGRILEEEMGCPNRFYCEHGSIISIEAAQVCDEIMNCHDGSDESKARMCQDGRFYCETRPTTTLSFDNPMFTPVSLMFNGRMDCADGSDECPLSFDSNVFSSRDKMISSTFLKVILWIVAFPSFLGNTFVFFKTVKKLRSKRPMNLIAKSHHIMIANLSVADGLMGLYLLMLCVASSLYSENFCMNNNLWRTSSWCQIMGTLVVLSSEASVFILMQMGIFRFYTIFRPFESQFSRQTFNYTVIGLAVSWVIAFALAFFPWVLEYFITHSFYISPFFKTDVIEQHKFQDFVNKLIAVVQRTEELEIDATIAYQMNVSRDGVVSVTHFTTQRVPSIKPIGQFGFYSQNSICLPSYFTRPGQSGWQYSLALVSLNFVLFFCMVVFYALIWYLSDSKRHIHGRSRNQTAPGPKMNHQKCQLQTRVARLLLTDFLCWIPVCILSYLYYSGAEFSNTANAVCGIVLLPINSALNPMLYAGVCDKLWLKFRARISKSRISFNNIIWTTQEERKSPRNVEKKRSNSTLGPSTSVSSICSKHSPAI